MVIDIPGQCRHCGRPDHLIEGDGPRLVCRVCVMALGQLANDPTGIRDDVIETMADRHGDVVVLITDRVKARSYWQWTGW
jgi:hypothetical protein